MATQPQQPVTSATPLGTDAGTDAPVKSLNQTQSIPYNRDGYAVGQLLPDEAGQTGTVRLNPETGELYNAAGSPSIQAGAGQNDDSGSASTENAQAVSNRAGQAANNDSDIKPRDNVLDQFSSYAWSASVYMLSPDQYNEFNNQQKKSLNSYNLLFQSGGASPNVGGPKGSQTAQSTTNTTGPGVIAGRNPFFTDDFFIENITINNALFGKATGAAHSVTSLKFTVIEPATITLIKRLYQAAQDIVGKNANGVINPAAITYVMVLRFYGYDQSGKPVVVGAAGGAGKSDSTAVVEKYIPFLARQIKWSMINNMISYEWDCAPVGQMTAASTRRGTIVADVEMSGSTVSEMLSGPVSYSAAQPELATPGASTVSFDPQDPETRRLQSQVTAATPAPPKASAAASKNVIRTGIVEAMNEKQKSLVQQGTYEVADIYEIVFANGAESIRDAIVKKPGDKVAKDFTSPGTSTSQNTQSLLPDRQRMDVTSRFFGITAGMQLVQAIELIIRNSSYIADQAREIFDDQGRPQPNPRYRNEGQGFRWFTVLFSAKQLKYDRKRNDFAYKITYTIAPYFPQTLTSNFFDKPRFRGLHKSYPVWFTGKNTAVIDYRADFNNLYIHTVTNSLANSSMLLQNQEFLTNNSMQIPFYHFQARSTESSQGGESRTNEIAANAAEYFYNPSDNGEASIRIIGDPAWILQGHVSGGVSPETLGYGPFNADGGINFDVMDVMFNVYWQAPKDYSLQSGLADPYQTNSTGNKDQTPRQEAIYRAKSVISEFRPGVFEQVINGTLYLMPPPAQKVQANTALANGQSTDQPTGDQRQEQPDTLGRSGSVPPAQADAGPIAAAGTALGTSLLTQNNVALSAAAGLQQAYTNNLLIPAVLPSIVPGASSGIFSTFGTTTADQIFPAAAASAPSSNGVNVGPATSGSSLLQVPVSGTVLGGVVVGAIKLGGQTILPGDPRYADAAYRLLQNTELQDALFASRQKQTIARDS